MTRDRAITRLKELQKEIVLIGHTGAILSWDQETMMPHKAVQERSEQLALLEGLRHRRASSDEIGGILSDLGADEDHPEGGEGLSDLDRAAVRETYRGFRRETRLPEDLVVRLARETSLAQGVWVKARETSDFALFAPNLKKLVTLLREKAERYGYDEDVYDALLDDYEPWMTTREVAAVFAELKAELSVFAARIANAQQVDDAFLRSKFPAAEQESFGRKILADIGFDLERGRLDPSAHPFTTRLGRNDVRLTTRYNEAYLQTSIFSTIHEAGHGMYELGFDDAIQGTILADCSSLGIHESQSRFWENVVGRSLPFWERYLPELVSHFPEELGSVDPESFYKAVNKVEPSLIRVDADEVTYGLHIVLRFELERSLLAGELEVEELPGAWNEGMERLIGVAPRSDSEGVLQDIHWSMGAMGYFPTYALGNLYSAQFTAALKKVQSDLDASIRKGEFGPIVGWLRSNIHRHGRRYTAQELCERISGETLNPAHFMEYLEAKYQCVYDM